MEPPWQARGRARSSAQWGPLRPHARGCARAPGRGTKSWGQVCARGIARHRGRKVPPGRKPGCPKVEQGEKAARRIHDPCGGVCRGWGGAVRKELGGSRPTVAERVAGELGLRKAGLSSSEVKQTVLAVHPGSRSPSGKLRPLLHQTLLWSLQPRAEAAAWEGLRLPVPADSQLIGP